MAILDASNSQIDFSAVTAYGAFFSSSASSYSWITADPGHVISVFGTGFTFNGQTPTGGTVTSISFDWTDGDHPLGVFDASITGLAVPLSALVRPANPAAGQVLFWETVLAGNDEIRAPSAAGGQLFGDFTNVVAEGFDSIFRQGGDDQFTASATESSGAILVRGGPVAGKALVGDGLFVQGTAAGDFAMFAEVQGGDDTFAISGKANYALVGDVQWLSTLGTVTGGDDTMTSNIRFISSLGGLGSNIGVYIGDVELNEGGVVFGGADRITGSNFAFTTELLIGDVRASSVLGGDVTGGADTLLGRSGQDFISGDVQSLGDGGRVTGGADLVRGGGDSDIISGDVFSVVSSTATPAKVQITCGNDRLFGDAGDDWIAGDLWDPTKATGDSTIVGGNDQLFGGDGDDQLYGEFGNEYVGLTTATFLTGGNDLLDGGLGDDLLYGQRGSDTASFASLALAVTVDLTAGTASGQGSDQLFSIENAEGSSEGDTLLGSSSGNALNGGGGNDLLNGRGGRDALIGSGGNDSLNGGGGNDDLDGGGGEDAFIFSTALDAATNVDRIADFAVAADHIELDRAVFSALSAGGLAGSAFAKGAGLVAAADGTDRIIYDTSTGNLYYDADGVNGAAAIKFATLTSAPADVTAANFLIV